MVNINFAIHNTVISFWWNLKIIHISQRHIKVIAIFVYLVFPVRPYDVAKGLQYQIKIYPSGL